MAQTKCWNCEVLGPRFSECKKPRILFCFDCGQKTCQVATAHWTLFPLQIETNPPVLKSLLGSKRPPSRDITIEKLACLCEGFSYSSQTLPYSLLVSLMIIALIYLLRFKILLKYQDHLNVTTTNGSLRNLLFFVRINISLENINRKLKLLVVLSNVSNRLILWPSLCLVNIIESGSELSKQQMELNIVINCFATIAPEDRIGSTHLLQHEIDTEKLNLTLKDNILFHLQCKVIQIRKLIRC